jgi:cell division protein YceG involved in septum cleavage
LREQRVGAGIVAFEMVGLRGRSRCVGLARMLALLIPLLSGAAGQAQAGAHPSPAPQDIVFIRPGWSVSTAIEALQGRGLDPVGAEMPAEGMLAAGMQVIRNGESGRDLIARLSAVQAELIEEAWAMRDEDLPIVSPEELLILASLVEKGTSSPAEQRLVASVLVNRLRAGHRLQIDASVVYGITQAGGRPEGELTRVELSTFTPWNTYAIDGLPPTAIAIPGRSAVFAAAMPARTDYFYWVPDPEGGIVFSATLQEHNAAVSRWRHSRGGAGQ